MNWKTNKNRARSLRRETQYFAFTLAKQLYPTPKYIVTKYRNTIFVERRYADKTEGIVTSLDIGWEQDGYTLHNAWLTWKW